MESAELRNTVQQLLIDASTIAEERVFKSRSKPVGDPQIPCILIFDSDEEVDEDNRTDKGSTKSIIKLLFRLQLWINASASTTNPDDELDDFCQAVRLVMDEERIWPGTIFHSAYVSKSKRLEDADKRLLWALITYRFSYLG